MHNYFFGQIIQSFTHLASSAFSFNDDGKIIVILVILLLIAIIVAGYQYKAKKEESDTNRELTTDNRELLAENSKLQTDNRELQYYLDNLMRGKNHAYPFLGEILSEQRDKLETLRHETFSRSRSYAAKEIVSQMHKDNVLLQKENAQLSNLICYICFAYPEVMKKERNIDISELRRKITHNETGDDCIEEALTKNLNAVIAVSLLDTQSVCYENAAKVFASYEEQIDDLRLRQLLGRAYKSAEIVKEIKAEKRRLITELNMYKAALINYEILFPWLEEFKMLDISDAKKYAERTADDEDYDKGLRNWLSPEEYQILSSTEKNKLALQRYQARHKSDWEIGIEYERYIGYLYEKDGWSIKYTGATEGLKDMGRDLVAIKGDRAHIIQCKRWAKEKTIHEKHVFQLYGTALVFGMKNPKLKVKAVFVTTASLSELAMECARSLDIEVRQNKPFAPYPMIKCNIGIEKERIYHLPFDQQYDRVIVEKAKGECYVSTIEEAEELGFRRAMRHRVETNE